jgi:hypothetical protein
MGRPLVKTDQGPYSTDKPKALPKTKLPAAKTPKPKAKKPG